MSFSDAVDNSSALPRLGTGHCWGENSKNKKFLAWSILDRLCFTNTQRPYVLPNNFRHTTYKRKHFRKLDGISFPFIEWQTITVHKFSGTSSLILASEAFASTGSQELDSDFNSLLIILQNYFSTHQLRATAVIPKRQAVLCCRENPRLHWNSVGTYQLASEWGLPSLSAFV